MTDGSDVEKPDLSDVSIEDLVDEIAYRCSNTVLLLDEPGDGGIGKNRLFWRGNFNACLGLSFIMKDRLMTEYNMPGDE